MRSFRAIGDDGERAWAGEMRRLRGVERSGARRRWVRLAILALLVVASVVLYVLFG